MVDVAQLIRRIVREWSEDHRICVSFQEEAEEQDDDYESTGCSIDVFPAILHDGKRGMIRVQRTISDSPGKFHDYPVCFLEVTLLELVVDGGSSLGFEKPLGTFGDRIEMVYEVNRGERDRVKL